jgi:chaperonin cofactor prefoldin
MFLKKMDYDKEIRSLKERIEELENRMAIIRVQYILIKSDRDRLKELISEKN